MYIYLFVVVVVNIECRAFCVCVLFADARSKPTVVCIRSFVRLLAHTKQENERILLAGLVFRQCACALAQCPVCASTVRSQRHLAARIRTRNRAAAADAAAV